MQLQFNFDPIPAAIVLPWYGLTPDFPTGTPRPRFDHDVRNMVRWLNTLEHSAAINEGREPRLIQFSDVARIDPLAKQAAAKLPLEAGDRP